MESFYPSHRSQCFPVQLVVVPLRTKQSPEMVGDWGLHAIGKTVAEDSPNAKGGGITS